MPLKCLIGVLRRFSKKWVQSHIDEIRKAGLDIPLVLQEYNLKPPFEYENERTDMFKAVRETYGFSVCQSSAMTIYNCNQCYMVLLNCSIFKFVIGN